MMFRILTIVTVASCCVLLLLLTATNPGTAGLGGMLAVFIFGYLSLLGVVTFLLYYGSRMGVILMKLLGARSAGHSRLPLGRAYLYASVLGVLPMVAIGLYSTGGVKWYELLLLILFGIIGIAYIARRA